MNKIGICYFRSLYSQSACSLSVGKLSDYLLNRGYNTNLYLLKNDSHITLISIYDKIMENDIIIYKTNYKDFEYGIGLFENMFKKTNKKIYLIGPFAFMNRERILKKYPFIEGIIDIQNSDEINHIFPDLGNKIKKDSIICGVDREIEIYEKGHYVNLESSTGCIYNCAFCHIKLMNYAKTKKPIELVVDEINELHEKLGKNYFIFNDSVFWKNNNDNERIEKFVKLLEEKKLNIYFMIYLSLTVKISDELLQRLEKVGLIRIFFGVENVSKSFSLQNNKYISDVDAENFINKLERLNISYHIGFMLFSKETKYDELQKNIDFLYKIRKLFRPGVLVEKMRILQNSKDSKFLYENESKIDQAYNYMIDDHKTEKFYIIVNQLFSNINIRNFEQFFSGIKIALTIIKRENLTINYIDYEVEYENTLNSINDGIYNVLLRLLNKLELSKNEIIEVKKLYSEAEVNYIKFMNYLKNNNMNIYETIPHGIEDLNVW